MQAQAHPDEASRRREFREWITPSKKAEFINGEVIMHSPDTSQEEYASSTLNTLMNLFAHLHSAGRVMHEKAMIGLSRNDYEPDICFFRKEVADTFTRDQNIFPAPDLVVEVLSRSTEKVDRTIKFEDYAAHGIREYWLIDPKHQHIEQYVLEEGAYTLLFKASTGEIASEVLSGFAIPVRAVFDDALAKTTIAALAGK